MLGLGAHQPEVLDSIVGAITVDVVDNFAGSQRATEVMGHDKAMLKDVPVTTPAVRLAEHGESNLVRLSDEDGHVALGIGALAPTPVTVAFATLIAERGAALLA